MLDLIRRLFGLSRGSDTPPGTVATITVRGYGRNSPLSGPARLTARSGGGTSLLAYRVEVGTGRNPSDRPYGAGVGDFPEGDYEVEAVLPVGGSGAAFGSRPALRLRARVGEATPPPLHGRNALVIHGGNAHPPADGAIRMNDADLARLLALLPDDPGQVLVQVFRPTENDADSGGADNASDDPWYETASAASDRGGDGSGTVPDPGFPSASSDAAGTANDQAAALALVGLGYAVLLDQTTVATEALGAAAAVTSKPSGAENGPEAGPPADTSAAAQDWTPVGGDYGR